MAESRGKFGEGLLLQGKRYSLANSRIMIHQPLGGAQGQAADIEIQANGGLPPKHPPPPTPIFLPCRNLQFL